MSLWLVRHAQPLIEPGVCYGALDVAADETATTQAAQALAQVLPHGARVSSSPLQRCERLTLVLCGLRPDLTYKVDARLVEMNFGCWEGQRWDSLAADELARWTADFWHHRFGGVESVADVMQRVAAAWDDAAAGPGPQVWVTHAGVIRAVELLAQGVRQLSDAAQWPVQAPGFGQWRVLALT
ncbi:histidine phosphatase family protein [Rhodoferax sp.]|uniref:histidine phosphatase family protein n=1 Tax=Rhodoferax sp. TaxID=50421 RepID=UPI00260C1474|nr:histidine phosphatase family protein [Rhodoferax sp.]MDD2927215.1 histidine phosphatase family protein [Rhodoferax sp.]